MNPIDSDARSHDAPERAVFRNLAFIIAAAVVCVAVFVFGATAFIRARNTSALNACINNLRQIDAMKQQWALTNSKGTNDVPNWEDLRPFLREEYLRNTPIGPVCPQGGKYTFGRMADKPTCSIGAPDHVLP